MSEFAASWLFGDGLPTGGTAFEAGALARALAENPRPSFLRSPEEATDEQPRPASARAPRGRVEEVSPFRLAPGGPGRRPPEVARVADDVAMPAPPAAAADAPASPAPGP